MELEVSDEKQMDEFVHTTLERLRTAFIEGNGQQGPLSVLLVRQDPHTNPPTVFSPPVVMTIPMGEHPSFPAYMGIVSASVAPWRAASLFLAIPGWVVEEGGKKAYKNCVCDGKHPEAKPSLVVFYEHESLPRKAWFAEVSGEPPQSIVLGNWQEMPFPPRATFAFPRTN